MSPASSPPALPAARPPAPFRYRNLGNLATIGRKEAVVDFGRLQLTGRFAWLVWGLAHIYFLIGFRNRMAVARRLAVVVPDLSARRAADYRSGDVSGQRGPHRNDNRSEFHLSGRRGQIETAMRRSHRSHQLVSALRKGCLR